MPIPIIATKLYIPRPRSKAVPRPRLTELLNKGLQGQLTLISASAGYGKTTLVSEWLAGCERPAAWISLDEGDNDLTRFLTYLIAALQTMKVHIGEGVFGVLQSPQSPPTELVLTALLNEIAAIPNDFVVVLDDYHVIDAKPVKDALGFILEHLPPPMHMVIITREDPQLPLPRFRVRGQLTELRVTDLRFTLTEVTGFLNQGMALNLSPEDISLLETRTEGWIAGLQLAAISMQGHQDATDFIQSFTGSHHYVLDYLLEEVLHRQSESVQQFLLDTSILDRFCGPLCDAIVRNVGAEGQETLEDLEHANLFIVPLDNERSWYRYHHLFADLLRQRLHRRMVSPTGDGGTQVAQLHIRASSWYEDNGLEIEAFQHAAAANDVERAARLMEGGGMPLHFRGAVAPVRNWLESLRPDVMNANPSLWVTYASVLLFVSQMTGVEQKLQAAEAALQDNQPDDTTRDLIGHIASIRATVAVSQHQVETIITQSRRALEYLHPGNLPVRTATTWALGYAYHLQGDRTAAYQAYTEANTTSQSIGHFIISLMATIGLGNIQETQNQLELAAKTYRHVLQLAGDSPLPVTCEAYLGLARISYEWNDLDAAGQYLQQSAKLAAQIANTDRSVACELLLARLKLTQGDTSGAAAILAKASHLVRQHNFGYRMSEVAAAQVVTLLQQDNLSAASQLVQTFEIPISQARVHLAEGDTATALAVLEPLCRQVEARGWEDERLKVMILQSVALQAHGEKDKAVQLLRAALVLAEPEGFIRTFVDEGIPMARLLSEAAAHGIMPDYVGKLLAVYEASEWRKREELPLTQPLIEPLSERELEVLQLIAQGLSNREISERLFLALSSVKGHNQNIFGKLQVQRRTEAVARARQLGLV